MDVIAIVGVVIVALVLLVAMRTVRIVPQAKARNVERLGRYRKTLEPGMNLIIPLIDRVKPLIDLREQVVSFLGQPVITEDNLVVKIDTVLFFQVTDPRAADYEIVDYIQAIEQLTATMLRSVIGSMDLEQSLTSRDQINTMLRGVLDDASGKWGIRVTRVEIKAIDPPLTVKEAMEKQMRAEREKRAAVLNAEGARQSQILTADGDKQSAILRAEGEKQGAILRAEGQAQAITTVFESIHAGDPDPKLLAYQYLQTLPQLAQGSGNTVWMIPSELTGALKALGSAFGAADANGLAGPVGLTGAAADSATAGQPAGGPPAGRAAEAGPAERPAGLPVPAARNGARPVAGGRPAELLAPAEVPGVAEVPAAEDPEVAGLVAEADPEVAGLMAEADPEVAELMAEVPPEIADRAAP
ncbi:MAG TPA: SPFH domain-containing protein [Streptosporangiaceae bacterium]|jgi:regulator of protease activity HflC (stomatin/prohibitin superfamily)